jgi:predicted MFS family arabinose efflux permease
MWNVAVGAARLAATPDDLQGKVTTASRLATYGALPIGSVLGGWMVDGLGSHAAVLAVATAMFVLAVLATASRSIRHPGTSSVQK